MHASCITLHSLCLVFAKCNRTVDVCLGVPEWMEVFYRYDPSWGIQVKKNPPQMNNFCSPTEKCVDFAICGIASAAVSWMSWPSVLFLRYTVKHLPPWLLHHCLALPHVDLAKNQKLSYTHLVSGPTTAPLPRGLTSPQRLWLMYPMAVWKCCQVVLGIQNAVCHCDRPCFL